MESHKPDIPNGISTLLLYVSDIIIIFQLFYLLFHIIVTFLYKIQFLVYVQRIFEKTKPLVGYDFQTAVNNVDTSKFFGRILGQIKSKSSLSWIFKSMYLRSGWYILLLQRRAVTVMYFKLQQRKSHLHLSETTS